MDEFLKMKVFLDSMDEYQKTKLWVFYKIIFIVLLEANGYTFKQYLKDEFFTIKYKGNGSDWKEKGCAQAHTVYAPFYEFYWQFEDEIKHLLWKK